MNSYYELKITCDSDRKVLIENVIAKSDRDFDNNWSLIVDESSSIFNNALFHLIKIVQDNKEKLYSIGIKSEDISFWFMYEYEEQCNMEFSPTIMKDIGDIGATLCVSCWEK